MCKIFGGPRNHDKPPLAKSSQGYKVNRLSNTFKKCYGRHTDLVGQYKKNVCQMFADSIS